MTSSIDDTVQIPPQGNDRDHDTLTADIESALRVALHEWIGEVASAGGFGRRKAAVQVLAAIRLRVR
jgi:hypothetical protein